MPTVLYLFRSPGTGHSIEQLFGAIRAEIEWQGLATQTVQLPFISRGVRSVWQNLRYLRHVTADVFHVTGDVHYAALALPASRTVLTIHDCFLLEHNRHRPLRYALFWLLWYYLPIRRAAVVTAVSEKTRADLIRYVGRVAHRVQVIANGYDPAFVYNPKPFNHHQPTILQIGTARHKNLHRLLAAVEGLACRLLIVGPLSDAVVAELHQRQIQFMAYHAVSRDGMVALYNSCDIVTFVSTYEGFGMPVLEANAVGRVVIIANQSPMREIANGAAHLVDPTDTKAIRDAIDQLRSAPSYRQHLIEAGLKNAEQYTIAVAARRYRLLYDQLLPAHGVSSVAL